MSGNFLNCDCDTLRLPRKECFECANTPLPSYPLLCIFVYIYISIYVYVLTLTNKKNRPSRDEKFLYIYIANDGQIRDVQIAGQLTITIKRNVLRCTNDRYDWSTIDDDNTVFASFSPPFFPNVYFQLLGCREQPSRRREARVFFSGFLGKRSSNRDVSHR